MKLLKFILPISALLMVFAVVESTAQICVYKEGEEYRMEDAIRYKGDNLKFIRYCCDCLGNCTPGNAVDGRYYLTHIASKYNRPAVLDYLVKEKGIPADKFPLVKYGETFEKQTPAMMGAESGSLDAVKYLVGELDVNVTRRNDEGRDTLYYAKKSGKPSVISYVQDAWNKAMGYAQARMEKNKKDLIRVLTINDIEKELQNFKREIKFNGFFA